MKSSLLTILFCSFLIMACSNSKSLVQTPQIKSQVLDTTKWKLLSIRGKKAKYNDAESRITISFNPEAKTVNGFSGCNRFFGNFIDNGSGNIQISEIGYTKRACPNESMTLEQAFLLSLSKINSYEVVNNELQLLQNERVVFVFEKEE